MHSTVRIYVKPLGMSIPSGFSFLNSSSLEIGNSRYAFSR